MDSDEIDSWKICFVERLPHFSRRYKVKRQVYGNLINYMVLKVIGMVLCSFRADHTSFMKIDFYLY